MTLHSSGFCRSQTIDLERIVKTIRFYPRDAMLAEILTVVVCLCDVCVRHTPVLYRNSTIKFLID